jgi:hypothetical protein
MGSGGSRGLQNRRRAAIPAVAGSIPVPSAFFRYLSDIPNTYHLYLNSLLDNYPKKSLLNRIIFNYSYGAMVCPAFGDD